MKFSMTRQDKVTFIYRLLLETGDRIDRFDCERNITVFNYLSTILCFIYLRYTH